MERREARDKVERGTRFRERIQGASRKEGREWVAIEYNFWLLTVHRYDDRTIEQKKGEYWI
jgi:hypothetical protein